MVHIISIKYGPAAAGIIGVLYTDGVQTDMSIEVPVLFKVAGHYRGVRSGGQLYMSRRRLNLGTKSWGETFSTKNDATTCVTCSLNPAFRQ